MPATCFTRKQTDEFYRPLFSRILDFERQGIIQQRVAEIFNAEGLRTISGGPFQQPHICRMLWRARELQSLGLLEEKQVSPV